MYYRNRTGLRGKARKELDAQLNCFRSHADKMQYADYMAAGLPIGSGVTEAGCKEQIKARFYRSGMRWNRDSGAKALQLRAIRLSDQWIASGARLCVTPLESTSDRNRTRGATNILSNRSAILHLAAVFSICGFLQKIFRTAVK